MSISDIVISSITGVAASYFVWWFTFKYLTPKIKFAPSISRITSTDNPTGFRYRFKFENFGSRNIIDIEVVIRVRIKGLRSPTSWEVVYLPISSLEYKKIAIVRPVNKAKAGKSVRPVFEIKAYECSYFTKPMFDEHTRTLAAERRLSLDHIMNIKPQVNLQVLLLAYDEFSGARKFFESKIMNAEDIVDGMYDKHSVYIKK